MPLKKQKVFVVHSHLARNHHYDLRLEMNGVLKSWAVPKEPPKTKANKRLAIQVEDHPLSYAKFEGIIPEGNYGAGKVEIWDEGTYELVSKDDKTPQAYPETFFKKLLTKGKIEIEFHGKKLKGKYVLVKTHYGNKPEKSWLFFKI
jgi:DNA ligase D-like protein (predicted 3'-phosphoesterase)